MIPFKLITCEGGVFLSAIAVLFSSRLITQRFCKLRLTASRFSPCVGRDYCRERSACHRVAALEHTSSHRPRSRGDSEGATWDRRTSGQTALILADGTVLSVGACGLWLVACGLWLVACGLWLVTCGLWLVACGNLLWAFLVKNRPRNTILFLLSSHSHWES